MTPHVLSANSLRKTELQYLNNHNGKIQTREYEVSTNYVYVLNTEYKLGLCCRPVIQLNSKHTVSNWHPFWEKTVRKRNNKSEIFVL